MVTYMPSPYSTHLNKVFVLQNYSDWEVLQHHSAVNQNFSYNLIMKDIGIDDKLIEKFAHSGFSYLSFAMMHLYALYRSIFLVYGVNLERRCYSANSENRGRCCNGKTL